MLLSCGTYRRRWHIHLGNYIDLPPILICCWIGVCRPGDLAPVSRPLQSLSNELSLRAAQCAVRVDEIYPNYLPITVCGCSSLPCFCVSRIVEDFEPWMHLIRRCNLDKMVVQPSTCLETDILLQRGVALVRLSGHDYALLLQRLS